MRMSDWSSDVCSSDLQFARVQDRQIMPRPRHLTWEESGCYTLTLATAYRMLFGHRPHLLRPGHHVLVWGASGGLGSMAIQLIATACATHIGVLSAQAKRSDEPRVGKPCYSTFRHR